MPALSIANSLQNVSGSTLVLTAAGVVTATAAKVYNGGRKSGWEREWGGRLIMIVAPAEPTTFALIHHLLHLPSPPQVLYLPPLASPLPQSLLTVLHALKLGATNKLAQLHCEALPPTPAGVRDFVRKWTTVPYGTAGEGGRRVDAIVLGGAWECDPPTYKPPSLSSDNYSPHAVTWSVQQYHLHLITSLLPALLKAPAERNIRVIQLVSPAWAAAMPGIKAGLEGTSLKPDSGLLSAAARRGVTSLLLQNHLKLMLDTLASAALAKQAVVPDPEGVKKRDTSVQSNILALSVIMPWARDEVVKPVWGAGSLLRTILWLMLYPLVLIWTPGPAMAVQSVLFALSAPILYAEDEKREEKGKEGGPKELQDRITATGKKEDAVTHSRDGVKQGDVVRDCTVTDLPPVLHDPLLVRATWEKLEKEVEAGVKAAEAAAKARADADARALARRGSTVKFAEPAEKKDKAKAEVREMERTGIVPGEDNKVEQDLG